MGHNSRIGVLLARARGNLPSPAKEWKMSQTPHVAPQGSAGAAPPRPLGAGPRCGTPPPRPPRAPGAIRQLPPLRVTAPIRGQLPPGGQGAHREARPAARVLTSGQEPAQSSSSTKSLAALGKPSRKPTGLLKTPCFLFRKSKMLPYCAHIYIHTHTKLLQHSFLTRKCLSLPAILLRKEILERARQASIFTAAVQIQASPAGFRTP